MSYVLTPLEDPHSRKDEPGFSATLMRSLWFRRYQIAAAAVLSGLVVLVISLLLPKTFQATSTVIVVPPGFATELRPPTFSVQTYLALSKSEAILREVEAKLGLAPEELEFVANIEQGREGRNAAYLPLIHLTVEADSADKAFAGSNTWSDIFSRATSELTGTGNKETLEFIESQYPESERILFEKQDQLKGSQDRYDLARLNLERDWNNRIVANSNETENLRVEYENESQQLITEFSNETAALISEHNKETERRRQELLDEWGLDVLDQKLSTKKSTLDTYEAELLGTNLRIKSLNDRLIQLRAALSKQSPFIVVSKAITDEALWERTKEPEQAGIPSSLDDLKLRSEVVNPIHSELAAQLSAQEVEYQTLLPSRQNLFSEIEGLKREIAELSSLRKEKHIGLFELEANRTLELDMIVARRQLELGVLRDTRVSNLKRLMTERSHELKSLEMGRDNVLQLLDREASLNVDRLKRQAESADQTYRTLASKFQSVVLAKSDDSPDVKIMARAVRPLSAVRPKPLQNLALGLTAGLVFSLGWIYVTEYIRWIFAIRERSTTLSVATPAPSISTERVAK